MRNLSAIDNYQIESISLAKKYLRRCKKKGININVSPFCDFVTWAQGVGNENLKQLIIPKKVNFKLLYFYLLEVITIAKLGCYLKTSLKLEKNNKKLNIIASYSKKSNYTNNGIFKDSYFNLTNKKNKIIWFLLSLDNYIPSKRKNLFIIHKKKNQYSWFLLIQMLIKNLFKKNFFYRFNNTTLFSEMMSDMFYDLFKDKKFNLYLPYESRPLQNALIDAAKKISKKNKIFAYLHNMPWPFQVDMIYKNKNIDILFVCSHLQKFFFTRYYGWPKKKIKVISSLRFTSLAKRKSTIFLPYEINNEKFYIKNLLIFFKLKKFNDKNLKISIHPLKKLDKRHINFKKLIIETIAGIKGVKKNKIKTFNSILIGTPGGMATECLQSVGKVYHITNNKYDIFSKKIWTNLDIKIFNQFTYEYTTIKKDYFIKLKSSKNFLKQKITENIL
tara:strand:- start:1282 stop:2613 length:1332 start_codon:yes stop_codon:yes gene_type:complete